MKKMPITKELREKIERVYKNKADAIWTEQSAEEEVLYSAGRARVIAELETLPTNSALVSSLQLHFASYNKPAEEISFADIAQRVCNLRHTPEYEAITEKYKAKKNDLPIEKENLLIKMSYAEDIEELKTLFAQANLVW